MSFLSGRVRWPISTATQQWSKQNSEIPPGIGYDYSNVCFSPDYYQLNHFIGLPKDSYTIVPLDLQDLQDQSI